MFSCGPQPNYGYLDLKVPNGPCTGDCWHYHGNGSSAIRPGEFYLSGVEDKEFECSEDMAVHGVADVPMSSGKTYGKGHTFSTCKGECAAATHCQSIVFGQSNGYCELWSGAAGAATSTPGHSHCRRTDTRGSCLWTGDQKCYGKTRDVNGCVPATFDR